MTLILRRPPELRRLNDMLDAAFQGFPFGPEAGNGTTLGWFPATDVVEDANGLRISLELPGVNPEQVEVTVENRTLTIKGQKEQVKEENSQRLHRYERSYGKFERSFQLPATVDAEKIEAHAEHGVLTLTLPRAEAAKARKIEIASR